MAAKPYCNLTSTILLLLLLFLLHSAVSEQDSVKLSLINFLEKLSGNATNIALRLGWSISSDPCSGNWTGIICKNSNKSIRTIVLESLSLSGSIDAALACAAPSLAVLSLQDNNLSGELPREISECTHLTHLYLAGNRLSGHLPSSLAILDNLKRVDISGNSFSGEVPQDLAKVSGLITFLANDNQLTGPIPAFDFGNLRQFNVSNNQLSGQIPPEAVRFGEESFSGNPELCGAPLAFSCAPAPSPAVASPEKKDSSGDNAVKYSGYILLALALLLFFIYKLVQKHKKKKSKVVTAKVKSSSSTQSSSPAAAGGLKNRSEYSISLSGDSGSMSSSSSLVVLKSPLSCDMKFDELLRSPAELIGRGRYGSLYKVMVGDGTATVVVKRIKSWGISDDEFRQRMEMVDRARHRGVLPLVGYYCSKKEKLVVYEFQNNGSLFNLLHGSQGGQKLDWSGRLKVAAGVAEGMAFMHKKLGDRGICHGNLKSSNIVMSNDMEARISEYGLVPTEDRTHPSPNLAGKKGGGGGETKKSPKTDVYGFGVVLLELLTGRLVEKTGLDLAQWVNGVVREEWTLEVFDRTLVDEGASEESMVRLLQVALKCVASSPDDRPSMSHVHDSIAQILDEDDRFLAS